MQEVKSALGETQALCRYILHSGTILTSAYDTVLLSGKYILTDRSSGFLFLVVCGIVAVQSCRTSGCCYTKCFWLCWILAVTEQSGLAKGRDWRLLSSSYGTSRCWGPAKHKLLWASLFNTQICYWRGFFLEVNQDKVLGGERLLGWRLPLPSEVLLHLARSVLQSSY